MTTTDQPIGLREAAALVNVTHETIRKWGDTGRITVGTDAEVLAQMNHNKQGRPHERFYWRDEVERAAREHRQVVALDPVEHVTLQEAERLLGVSSRTLARLRRKHELQEFYGEGRNEVHLSRAAVRDLIGRS